MTKEQLKKLTDIYNATLDVHTCGQDSWILSDCQRSLHKLIQELIQEQRQEENKEE